jgi:hypothetical protein
MHTSSYLKRREGEKRGGQGKEREKKGTCPLNSRHGISNVYKSCPFTGPINSLNSPKGPPSPYFIK